jgi:choline dehydrogenase-like flavoprotein
MTVDTLIIGSGVAASAVAQTLLSRDPKSSILILEAGARVKTKDFGLWEHYLITGQLPYDAYKDLQYPQNDIAGENMSVGGTDVPLAGSRVMVYGGSTIHWGGWSFRLKQEDFHLKTSTGRGQDWPFDYEHLEPYYCRAEEYIGVSGDSADCTVPRSRAYPFPAFPYTLEDQPLASALEALNINYSHVPIARHGVTNTTSKQAPCQTTGTCKYCPFGARFAAVNFLDDMLAWNDYPNFRAQTETVVEQILVSEKSKASSVVIKRGDESEVIEAERIIVAAGTIESAKLLLRSVSRYWPRGLGNDNDLVGRFLITHPYFIFRGTLPSNPLKLQKEMDFPTLCSRHFDGPEEQSLGKFILVNPPDTVDPKVVSMMRAGKTRAEIDAAILGPQTVSLHGMVEVFGHMHNRVKNSEDRPNRIGLRQTIVDYTKDEWFDARMGKIEEHVKQIFQKMGVATGGKASVSWRADHAASTCRMGADPATSVVDPYLRVHGVDNVYVCSNATFPSLGAINPTLTLAALALRLGDHLSCDSKKGEL